jgi:hypothetical protein
VAGAGRHWTVAVEGHTPTTTNDLTLAEVEIAEQVSGIPWTLMNPHASMRTAIALVAIVARRSGMGDDEAVEYARALPVSKLHRAFVYVDGEALLGDDDELERDPPGSAPTSANG